MSTGSPCRDKIRALLAGGDYTFCELTEKVGCDKQTTRRNIHAFIEMGLVEFKRFGPIVGKGQRANVYGWMS